MPERDGYEVAAFIKNDPQLAHIPVILLTGAFEPLDEDRARRVGCDGVLVKPFEPQMVINRVKELLSNRRPVAAAAPPLAATPAPQPGGAPVRSADTFAAALDASLEPPPRTSEVAKTNDALEAYFDRLDAAFASIGEPGSRKRPPPRRRRPLRISALRSRSCTSRRPNVRQPRIPSPAGIRSSRRISRRRASHISPTPSPHSWQRRRGNPSASRSSACCRRHGSAKMKSSRSSSV
jgi:hypothetical protein